MASFIFGLIVGAALTGGVWAIWVKWLAKKAGA